MKKIVGILGGLGPETTAHFYTDLVRAATVQERPAACIWSLPLNLKREAEYIGKGRHLGYYRSLLLDGLTRLEKAGSEFVVIPCNTVHEFHFQLAQRAKVPVVNLIDIVAREVERRGWNQITLLATSRTVGTRLYQRALDRVHITVHLPTQEEQRQLDALIMGLLGEGTDPSHQQFLQSLIERTGTKNVVLGCTDLQLLTQPMDTVVDSTKTLVRYTTGLLRT